MQMMFMKTWPPLPRTTAYRDTKGWGEPNEKSVSASGAQKRKRMIVANPPTPLATVLQKIPRAAVTDAFLVSSATWPEASNPIKIPAVAR
jgi:hypothetical protein